MAKLNIVLAILFGACAYPAAWLMLWWLQFSGQLLTGWLE